MKVNIQNGIKEQQKVVSQSKTFVAQNVKRTSVFLDRNGNEIDPRTKQIIKRADHSEE